MRGCDVSPLREIYEPDDAVQEFFENRITALTALLIAEATSDESFGRLVRRTVQNWLIDRARETGTGPLRRSIEKVLAESVAAIDADHGSTRARDWPERDRAIVFTSLLAGLRADELLNVNVGDIRRTDDGAVLHVRGKGNKDRRIPIGTELLDVLDEYLQTRATRFPQTRRRASSTKAPGSFSPTAPLFVGADGERITRGTLQYRILRAFKKAGLDGERASGALVHGLRHTFATANVSVYTLMKLMGHESMVTSQRYVDGAGTETRSAAELNPLYGLLGGEGPHP